MFQEIFDEVVRRCVETGLVTGETLVMDATHVRANASDAQSGIVTDIHVTSGNVNEPVIRRMKRQIETFGFSPQAFGADSNRNRIAAMQPLSIKAYRGSEE